MYFYLNIFAFNVSYLFDLIVSFCEFDTAALASAVVVGFAFFSFVCCFLSPDFVVLILFVGLIQKESFGKENSIDPILVY